jgi:hypothetical protein
MSTREDIKNAMAFMACSYPNYHPILEGQVNAVDVMFNLLGDLPVETLQVAVQACCAEPGRAFAPSAGEIRGMAIQLHAQAAELPTAAEAWGLIMESFKHITSERETMLAHPLIQEAIRCMGGLERIGLSEDNMADRAHFLKIYQQLYDRELSYAAQLPAVTTYIEAQKQIGGEIKQLADSMSHPRLEKR